MIQEREHNELISTGEMVMYILSHTNDGELLEPQHLSLLQWGVNDELSDKGIEILRDVYHQVEAGTYRKQWFHGIENLTISHNGYVYWKNSMVEHYAPRWAYTKEAAAAAEDLALRCISIEAMGGKPDIVSCILEWRNGPIYIGYCLI